MNSAGQSGKQLHSWYDMESYYLNGKRYSLNVNFLDVFEREFTRQQAPKKFIIVISHVNETFLLLLKLSGHLMNEEQLKGS